MKSKSMISLLTLSVTALYSAGWAQVSSSPTNAGGTSGGTTSRPHQKATGRHANPDSNPNTPTSSGSASSSDGQYRQSAAANGTAVNNSNSTNYNSNNVTNAPTGVGSNPSVSTDPTSLQGNAAVEPTASPSGSGTRTTTGATKAVITGAGRSPEPAVVAGSTERNTSIHDFIASSPNYVTLQNALQSVDLYTTLKDGGSYTLFAPSNNAFKKLPASMQSSLLEGRNTEALKQLLSYHLVQGTIDAAELTKRIKAGGGKTQLQTLAGGMLTAKQGAGGNLTLTDEQGKTVSIESPDKQQSNGVVHEIDGVLLPKAAAKTFAK
ncbi:fasciclin domain-containing protein [Spirosoma koreense]